MKVEVTNPNYNPVNRKQAKGQKVFTGLTHTESVPIKTNQDTFERDLSARSKPVPAVNPTVVQQISEKKTVGRTQLIDAPGFSDILNDGDQALCSFYKGEISIEELKESYANQYRRLSALNQTLTAKYGSCLPEDNVLDYAMGFYQYAIGRCGAFECFNEGKQILQSLGENADDQYVYYDADYYYMAEDAHKALFEVSKQLAAEAGVDYELKPLDNLNFSFNGDWNNIAYNMVRSVHELGINDWAAPPENFEFFYLVSSSRDTTIDYDPSMAISSISSGAKSKNIYNFLNGNPKNAGKSNRAELMRRLFENSSALDVNNLITNHFYGGVFLSRMNDTYKTTLSTDPYFFENGYFPADSINPDEKAFNDFFKNFNFRW